MCHPFRCGICCLLPALLVGCGRDGQPGPVAYSKDAGPRRDKLKPSRRAVPAGVSGLNGLNSAGTLWVENVIGDVRAGTSDLVLWDVTSGKQRWRHPMHMHFSTRVFAYSRGDKLLAVAGHKRVGDNPFPGWVEVWDVAKGEKQEEFGSDARYANPFTCAEFSPDGETLAVGDYKGTIILSKMTGREVRRTLDAADGQQPSVRGVAFSHDGKLLAAQYSDQKVRLWDITTGKHRSSMANYNGGPVLTFSPDDKILATAESGTLRGGSVRLWDVGTGKELHRVEDASVPVSAAFSRDGKFLVHGTTNGTVTLSESSTGKVLGSREVHSGPVFVEDCDPDGNFRVFGQERVGQEDQLLQWSISHRYITAK